MIVRAISDLHGNLPVIEPCDVLLLGGDYPPLFPSRLYGNWESVAEHDRPWFCDEFHDWLERVPADRIIAVAGNHDILFQVDPAFPKTLPWEYLRDEVAWLGEPNDINSFKVWGTPWTPSFGNWAFMDGDLNLRPRFDRIPSDTDIILAHGPPYGVCDVASRGEHVGSTAMRFAVRAVEPQVLVCGHIHEARGIGRYSGTHVLNVSHVNSAYQPTWGPAKFDPESGSGVLES